MQLTITIGIVIFCFLALIIANGYKQMQARAQHLHNMTLKRKLAQMRDWQFIFNAMPTAYFPKEAQLMLAQDIVNRATEVLKEVPTNPQAKDLHRSFTRHLEKIMSGEMAQLDQRQAKSLSEAESIRRMTCFISEYLKNRYRNNELTHQELTELHQQLETANSNALIDGELHLGNNALDAGKLQSAYYHFDRVCRSIKLLQSRTNSHESLARLTEAKKMLSSIKRQIEAKGESVYDPNQPLRAGVKAWDSLMEEEAKYSRENPELD